MDVVIVYEREQRELENALLLQIELESRGLSCKVIQYYEASNFNFMGTNTPKVLLVPHLYGNSSIYRNFTRFGKADYIINMQYEQVLSEKWEKLGHHDPKGEAKKAFHICWGENVKNRLKLSGIPENNLKVIAPLHLDLLREKYRKNSKVLKENLGTLFGIDDKKKWTLFISSFTYADIDKDRLKMNEIVAQTSLEDFPAIHTTSRDKILEWFKLILEEDPNNIFIYRPHPDELNLEKVIKLEQMYANFKCIRYSSVKEWIESCDSIYSWYSTSVVESHFLGKHYSILRPINLSDNFDSVLIKKAKFINTYEDFKVDYFLDDSQKKYAISDKDIEEYYQVDKNRESYKIYADFIEKLLISNKEQEYTLSPYSKIYAYFTTINVSIMYFLYRVLNKDLNKYRQNPINQNYFIKWFLEMDNQIVSRDEKDKIKDKIKQIIKLQSEK